jgi:hypothetical protein
MYIIRDMFELGLLSIKSDINSLFYAISKKEKVLKDSCRIILNTNVFQFRTDKKM